MAKAPRVSVKFEVDSTGYSAAVGKMKAQMIDFGEASKRVNHGMVSDVQAASGTLRLLDGGIANNIRSAERFLASINGVGDALRAIYPLVGGIAIGAVLARGVSELVNFQKKAKDAGDEFKRSWQEMTNSSRLGNDELAKTNVQLENQIAKLEGKHENMLALELAESRIEATKLAQAAESARDKVQKLFEEKEVGFGSLVGAYRMVFKGEAPTSDTQKFMQGYDEQIAQTLQDRADALHTGNQSGADAAQKRYTDLLSKQQGEYSTRLSGYRRMQREGQGNYQANIDALQGGLNVSYGASDRIGEEAQNKKDETRLKGLEDAKASTAKMMERYRQQFGELQASMTVAPGEEAGSFRARELAAEADFWAQKLATAKKGTDAYREIEQQLNAILREGNQQYAAAQNEALELEKARSKFIAESFGDNLDLTRDSATTAGLRSGGRDGIAMVEAMNKSVAIGRENSDAWREAKIQMDLAAGTISKLDAAMQAYQLHREQHERDLADIESRRQQLKSRYGPESSVTSLEGRAAYQDLANQYDTANGGWMKQQAIDKQAITGQTPMGAWKNSLSLYVQQSRDAAAQVREIWGAAFSSINDQILQVMTERHHWDDKREWENVGSGIFKNIAGVGLQKAEGAALGALGFGHGKPDGSQGNPLFVKMAGMPAVAGGGGLLDGLFGGQTDTQGTSSSSGGFFAGLGHIASSIFSGLGFADGGQPPVDVASLVGEHGPELFVPKVAGTVVPNSDLGSRAPDIHLHLDARGASDPAAMEAAANRAIYKALPHIAAATTHAQQNSRGRMAPSRRS